MKKVCLFFTAALFSALLGINALAAIDVVEPTDVFYVADYAHVLSAETEDYIVSLNEQLESATGGQIVVVTVDFTGDVSSENYAYTLFNEWGIGDADKNNGFLLLLVTGRSGYWMMPGSGTEKFLPAGELQDIANTGFLDYYDAQAYDEAVIYCVGAVSDAYASYYGLSFSGQAPAQYDDNTTYYWNGGYGNVGMYGIGILFFIVVALLFLGGIGRRRYYRRGYGGGMFWMFPFFWGNRYRRPPWGPGPGPGPRGPGGPGTGWPPGTRRPPGGFGGFGGSGGGSTRGGGFGRSGGFGGSRGGGSHFGGGGGSRGGGVGR